MDGWISNAKKLRNDIKSSQEDALEIAQQGEQSNVLESTVHDATNKLKLLQEEHAFNHELRASLQQLQALRERLDKIQSDILHDRLPEVGDGFSMFQDAIAAASTRSISNVRAALSSKAAQLRSDATERLLAYWNTYIAIDQAGSRVTIKVNPEDTHISLALVAEAMDKLKILDGHVLTLSRAIEQLLIRPRLHVQGNRTVQSLTYDRESIKSGGSTEDLSAKSLFSDLQGLIEFLQERLPPSIIRPLSDHLGSQMITRVVSPWLLSAVPTDLDDLEDFQKTVELVQDFSLRIDNYHWPGKSELDEWTNSIPDVWVRKRYEVVLDRTRKLLATGITSTSTAERTETQVISRNDDVFASKESADDWNANWSDDEADGNSETAPRPSLSHSAIHEDDDGGAWGLDEKDQATSAAQRGAIGNEEEDGTDAWGWGDDEEQSSPIARKSAAAKPSEKITNGLSRKFSTDDQQQVTLRETYTITSLPPELLEIIKQVQEDCRLLDNPPHNRSQLGRCGASLKHVPITTLAFFRAISTDAYAMHLCGSMLLYNDCQWLAEQLRHTNSFEGSDFDTQAGSLEVHGKRAYSKEMDSQRTIINDLLDGAQGFINCTQHPFNQECDVAVASTVDRIRQLQKQWKDILSHSALLQAIGSLLSTICSKLILEVEDMSDISEPESQQLTKYCSRIGNLEDIFTPQVPDGSSASDPEIIPLTAAYVASWLKFQYLANILESSLADIKYLWIDGGLSLEFEIDEVIDLIVALFAEGPYRRSAINEIRAARPNT